MKTMMVVIAACAAAGGTLLLLRGGDLGQVREKAKRAMGRAEEEMGDMMDEMSSAPAYVPAPARDP